MASSIIDGWIRDQLGDIFAEIMTMDKKWWFETSLSRVAVMIDGYAKRVAPFEVEAVITAYNAKNITIKFIAYGDHYPYSWTWT